MKSNRFFNIFVAVLFVIFIAVIIFIVTRPKENYSFVLSPEETLQQIKTEKDIISPVQLAQKLISGDSDIVLIDIRNQYEYIKGHLSVAKNICKAEIFEKENYRFFKKMQDQNKTVIFYGNDVVEADIPYLILKQTGIDNIKIVNGSYTDFAGKNLKEIAQSKEYSNDIDRPDYDFATLIRKEHEKEILRKKEEQKKKAAANIKRHKKTVKPKKKKVELPPPEEEEEEDEGC